MEEIEKLRVGKEHTEAALNKIAMMGTLKYCTSIDGRENTSKTKEVDQTDDDVSKLTFKNDSNPFEGVETIGNPMMKMGRVLMSRQTLLLLVLIATGVAMGPVTTMWNVS